MRAVMDAVMDLARKQNGLDKGLDLGTLLAAIAHSQIVVARPAGRLWRLPSRCLPPGYDDTDIAILDWIAAEGRRVGRNYLPM